MPGQVKSGKIGPRRAPVAKAGVRSENPHGFRRPLKVYSVHQFTRCPDGSRHDLMFDRHSRETKICQKCHTLYEADKRHCRTGNCNGKDLMERALDAECRKCGKQMKITGDAYEWSPLGIQFKGRVVRGNE